MSLFTTWSIVSEVRLILKTAIFGHDIWPMTKVSEVTNWSYALLLPRGSKLILFAPYGPPVLKYEPIFKIAIFGHKTWPLAKVPEVGHKLLFYPKERIWTYFYSTGSGSRDTGRFQRSHIWAWNFVWTKFGRFSILPSLLAIFIFYNCENLKIQKKKNKITWPKCTEWKFRNSSNHSGRLPFW